MKETTHFCDRCGAECKPGSPEDYRFQRWEDRRDFVDMDFCEKCGEVLLILVEGGDA